MRRSAAVIALLIVPMLALSGCTPASPQPTVTPKPSSTPLFANEEGALKAATEAYAAYLKVSDQITADGGLQPERIAPYVTNAQLKNETRGFALYSKDGHRTQGKTTFSAQIVERYDSRSVQIYACVDFSNSQLLDSSGADITPVNRADRQAFELSFAAHRDSKKPTLLLDGSELWAGDGIC